jgi:hypothetical protein
MSNHLIIGKATNGTHSASSFPFSQLFDPSTFPKTCIGFGVPFAISLALFCFEVIRNGFSCSA